MAKPSLPTRPRTVPPPGPRKTGLVPSLPPHTFPSGVVIQVPPIPQEPPVADYTHGIFDWGRMLNDRIGDCVLAAMGHVLEMWTSYTAPAPYVWPDNLVTQAYTALTGYSPATGVPDPGMQVKDGLNYWKANGIGPHSLIDYAQIFPKNIQDVRRGIAFFGAAIIGMGMNDQMIRAFDAGSDWNTNFGAFTEYHAVPLLSYDGDHFECITWGSVQRMNRAFYDYAAREAYILIGPDWFRNGTSPSGYTAPGLQEVLRNIKLNEAIV